MTTDYYILKILATLLEDNVYRQVYAAEIRMLLDKLSESESIKLDK